MLEACTWNVFEVGWEGSGSADAKFHSSSALVAARCVGAAVDDSCARSNKDVVVGATVFTPLRCRDGVFGLELPDTSAANGSTAAGGCELGSRDCGANGTGVTGLDVGREDVRAAKAS